MIKRGDQIQLYLFNYFAYFLVAALLITSYFVQGSLAQGEHNFTESEFTWDAPHFSNIIWVTSKKHKKLRVSFILLTLVESNRSPSHPDTKNYPKFKLVWSFGTNQKLFTSGKSQPLECKIEHYLEHDVLYHSNSSFCSSHSINCF